MQQEQLDNLIKELKISADQILREEAEMIFLNALAVNKLGSQLVFYGGTALRLAYGSPRFSEDIDLVAVKDVDFREIGSLAKSVAARSSNWHIKDVMNKKQTMFVLFMISDDKLKHNFSMKIELHKPVKKVDLAEELLLIKSPASVFEPLLLVPSIKKVRELKIKAIRDRKKARDVFDLWYISRLLKTDFELPEKIAQYDNKREFSNELKVFLPKQYYKVIDHLYDKVGTKN